MPIAMTANVLWSRCTITLSITTWLKSGVPSASSWMKSEANSTSRHTRLCFRSSGMNHPNPNARCASWAPSGTLEGICEGRKLEHRARELGIEGLEREGERLNSYRAEQHDVGIVHLHNQGRPREASLRPGN